MAAKKKRVKPGPEAERIKVEGDWKEAVAKALGKKRPDDGWPKPKDRQRPTRRRKTPAC